MSYFVELEFELVAVLVHVLQAFGHIPEADVGEDRLEARSSVREHTTHETRGEVAGKEAHVVQHHHEVGPSPELLVESVCQLEQTVHVLLEAAVALGSPHEPDLEDVDVATALDGLVARVVRHIVVLVLLEQVGCVHLIAVLKYSLQHSKFKVSLRGSEKCNWFHQDLSTVCLTRKAEHCSKAPMSLCGFQVTESALELR